MGNFLRVLCQAQETHEVDETGGKIELAAKLTCSIVVGKCVVIIVKPLTWKEEESVVNTSVADKLYGEKIKIDVSNASPILNQLYAVYGSFNLFSVINKWLSCHQGLTLTEKIHTKICNYLTSAVVPPY